MPLTEEAGSDDLAFPEMAALGGKISPFHDEQESQAYAQPESTEHEKWADRQVRRLQTKNEQAPDYSNRGQYGGDDASQPNALVIHILCVLSVVRSS